MFVSHIWKSSLVKSKNIIVDINTEFTALEYNKTHKYSRIYKSNYK